MKILLAEDDPVAARIMRVFLEGADHEVFIVNNGLELLEFLSENHDMDIILTDIKMATVDGITATKIIKLHVDIDMPIFAITGCSDQDIIADQSIFNEIFHKPLNIPQIITAITKLKRRIRHE